MRFSLFGKRRIYADWAATTPMDPRVARAMTRARKSWANPSAIYKDGVEAKRMLEAAHVSVAGNLGVKPEEVFFTSGGTEANATIIQGVIRASLKTSEDNNSGAKNFSHVHVVSSSIEHSSVLETLKIFEKQGVRVTYVPPGHDGIVRAEDVLAAIKPNTVLVTCMYANNEIGTIQPVSKIGAGIRKMRAEKVGKAAPAAAAGAASIGADYPVFHTDASQAPLWLSCDLEGLRADAITLDAHKMCGPKGVGALVARRHVLWEPLMEGGGQERGKRPTTESVALATGFAKALELAQGGSAANRGSRAARVSRAALIQQSFIYLVTKELPGVVINGSIEKRLPNNLNISLPDLTDPELAVLFLDKEGIACSTKSSCLKGEEESYVVKALGTTDKTGAMGKTETESPWRARNTLRFTLAPNATKRDVITIVEALKKLQKLPKTSKN